MVEQIAERAEADRIEAVRDLLADAGERRYRRVEWCALDVRRCSSRKWG